MARPLRIEYEGALYHVTSRGNGGADIFHDDEDRKLFLKILGDVAGAMEWVCYGYCLMGNHYHLMLETPRANLCKGMRQLNGIFTQSMNRKHERSGHLFQGRYKAILVEADSYLLELTRYVMLNPVRAGFSDSAESWGWSSYRASVGLDPVPEWLAADHLLSHFANDESVARKALVCFVDDGVGQADIWKRLNRQVYLGCDVFVAEAQQQAGLNREDKNIPGLQRNLPVKSLQEIAAEYPERNDAIIAAYATGAYSYSRIGDFFGLYFTTVGRIVRGGRNSFRSDCRPDPVKIEKGRGKKRAVEEKVEENQRQLSLI